jgi:RNA recognition motif-containing protein
MINKSTGLSKGYGFVSYSARDEALAAIGAMDGFRVSTRPCPHEPHLHLAP